MNAFADATSPISHNEAAARRHSRSWLSKSLVAFFGAALLAGVGSCNYYDPPPETTIKDAPDGVLSDNTAPVVLQFSEPIVPGTLRFEIAMYEKDDEGNLKDEQTPPKPLTTLFTHTPEKETGGKGVLAADNKSFTITFDKVPPIGKRLVVLIEPGLSDSDGNDTVARRQILFGYEFGGKLGTKIMTSGYYLFLIDVTSPIKGVQIQVFGDIRVDQTAGTYTAQFTNADRNTDLSRPGCADLGCNEGKDACRLIPTPACVPPSEKAASEDTYSDFIPNPTTPKGYSFYVTGYVSDQDNGSVAITNDPVDVHVLSPDIKIVGLILNGAFTPDATGILRGTGSFTSTDVLLSDQPTQQGQGTLTAIRIPDGKAPAGIPAPEGLTPQTF